jgi:hypothetical protein
MNAEGNGPNETIDYTEEASSVSHLHTEYWLPSSWRQTCGSPKLVLRQRSQFKRRLALASWDIELPNSP